MKPAIKTTLLTLCLLALLLAACQGAPPVKTEPAGTKPVTQAPVSPVKTEAPARPAVTKTLSPTTKTQRTTEDAPHPAVTRPVSVTAEADVLPMPVLTADNQNLTYGAGQMIAAFGEGFLPGEAVAVALIHAEQGVLLNKSAEADGLGYLLAVKRLPASANEKDAPPPGQYTYRFSGSSQTQELSFKVEYFYQPEPAAKGCGFYPEKAVFNGYQVFWCAGLEAGLRYALTSRLGEQMDQVINTSDAFGLVVFPLRQSSDTLTPGLWTVSLGQVLDDDQEPVDAGVPPLSVQILAPGGVNP